jgi:hypothetical protein
MRLALFLILVLVVSSSEAQTRQPRNALRSTVQDRVVPSPQSQESLRAAVRDVENGLRISTMTALTASLAPTVQLALPGLGRGDYSSNQAAQLLSGYFSRRPVRTASIDRLEASVASPYASGTVVVNGDGRDTLRLYLSFASVESRWLITHVSLY